MLRVGITGGIGSGKSTVCKIFEQLGVAIYNADNRAKLLMQNDSEIIEKLCGLFSSDIYDANGKLNNKLLAKTVFADNTALAKLNAVVHPVVAEDFEKWANLHAKANYIIKEAAILFETKAYKLMDCNILVTAPEDLRINRVMLRDGSSKQQVQDRIDKQWPDKRKQLLADKQIYNNEKQLLLPQVMALHKYFTTNNNLQHD